VAAQAGSTLDDRVQRSNAYWTSVKTLATRTNAERLELRRGCDARLPANLSSVRVDSPLQAGLPEGRKVEQHALPLAIMLGLALVMVLAQAGS
jgi:hypothetical protein